MMRKCSTFGFGTVFEAAGKAFVGLVLGLFAMVAGADVAAPAATVLFEDRVVPVAQTLPDANDLWVAPEALPAINGFTLKPEGACFEDICVPVKQSEDGPLFVTRRGQHWFNVSGLANRLQQPYVVDHEAGVWSFGALPVSRQRFTEQGLAPDFTLTDWQGQTVSLSDFKGKKVMLLSWASW